ncbi:MAG: S9 family peptidase [Bacteroidales bacterium]|nr:S9 family peptidase [Bacteroidales bacterium]
MNKFIPFIIIAVCLIDSGCKESETTKQIYDIPAQTYPVTKKLDVSDTFFGTMVQDPYRWLENDTAQEVAAWVEEQNQVTGKFLEMIPFRDKIKSQLEETYNYTRITSVMQAGEYTLYVKNDGLQNQSVIYKKKGDQGAEEVFIDPNQFSTDGTVAVSLIGISKDRKLVAFTKSVSGSDWQEIFVKEIATGRDLPDQLKNVKFTGASWFGNGFFYSRFPQPEKGKELQALNQDQKVYYHKLGEPQEKDLLIYEDNEHPLRYNNVSVSEDNKYLFLYVAEGTDGYECYYKPADLKKGGFVPLFTGFANKSTVIEHQDGLFFVHTDIGAPNYRLVAIDPREPARESWKEIIPENKHLLEQVFSIGGKIFALYLQDVTSHLYQFGFDGKQEKEIEFPVIGSAGIEYGSKDESRFFYSFSSFTYPKTIYSYDVKTGTQSLFFQPDAKLDPGAFEVKQVFYTSKDSTRVPMFIVHKKGIQLNGKNPALLYGYGGFNISETPGFSASLITLVEYGAVYAIANLRGGSEYGEAWHKAGMLLNKQNVFDDFIAAAEYLIDEKYTTSSRLGIYGGSNGGLLVGASMIQRPDLFKVAIPAVGVMDMLRYHKFTVGFGWVPEYGSSEDSVNFRNLYAYSPLHNLKAGVEYPATLVTTSDHDDRVVPAHSFKFIATLQEKQAGKNPVLIRIETKAGHGGGKPVSKIIEEAADKWAFFLYNTQTPVK